MALGGHERGPAGHQEGGGGAALAQPAGEHAAQRGGAEEDVGVERQHPAAEVVGDVQLQRRVAVRGEQGEGHPDDGEDDRGGEQAALRVGSPKGGVHCGH